MFHTSHSLQEIPYVTHGFFTRKGGKSEGIYGSLNVGIGSNDQADHIQQNREIVRNTLNPEAALCTLHQIHSNKVILADNSWSDEHKPEADAIITRENNKLLGVLTADCGPILLAAKNTKLVATVHAGWKGALTNIIQNTIDAMCLQGTTPDQITACLGACIHQTSYEVDTTFLDRFITENNDFDRFFTHSKKSGHFMFNLPAFIIHKLEQTGVKSPEQIPHDTYTMKDDYFSYRRSCHNNEPDYGRHISVIGIQ